MWELDALSCAVDVPQGDTVATHEVAGIGARFLAGLIDFTIRIPVEVAVVLFVREQVPALAGGWPLVLMLLFFCVVNIAYSFLFELLADGQTPGKNACGLKVAGVDGGVPGARRLLVRNVLRVADWLPFCYAGGLAFMLSGAARQRLGDRVAGTVVIHDVPLREMLQSVQVSANVYSTAPDGYLLESFLWRCDTLKPEIAGPLARQVADYFYRKYPPTQSALIDSYSRGDYRRFLAELYREETGNLPPRPAAIE